MTDNDKLLKDLYRRAMAICHPDRAPSHLHSFLETKAKELNTAYEAGSFARVRKVAEELGIKDIPPMPQSEFAPKPTPELRTEEIRQALLDGDLFFAAGTGNLRQVIRALSSGANPIAKYDTWKGEAFGERQTRYFGGTALHQATFGKYAEIVNAMLSAGANPNATDDAGRTALMLAAGNNDTKIAKLLVSTGANLSAKDNNGFDTLSYLYSMSGFPFRHDREKDGYFNFVFRPLNEVAEFACILGEHGHPKYAEFAPVWRKYGRLCLRGTGQFQSWVNPEKPAPNLQKTSQEPEEEESNYAFWFFLLMIAMGFFFGD